MRPPRPATNATGSVLAAYVLALLVAMVAPIVAPVSYDPICTATGIRYVPPPIEQDTSSSSSKHAALDCPLCVPGGAPPAPAHVAMDLAAPTARPWVAPPAPAVQRTSVPPPARAPPGFS